MRNALIFPALLLAAAAPAQDAPPPSVPQDAAPAPASPSDSTQATEEDLAFLMERQRMTVPVQVAGTGPHRFIIDTGAQRTVISRELASELNLPRGRDVGLIAMTGRANVGTVLISSLSVSSFAGAKIEAPALERRHMGANGILGIDTLQGHAVAIDFDTETMRVSPSTRRKRRARPSAPGEIVIQAKSLFGQLVVTDADFRGTKVRVILDTGTEVSMGNEALRRRVARSHKGMRDIELISVIGGKMVAGYTQVPQVKIGAVTFENLPIAFSASAPFKEWGLVEKPALLLGMDALRMFRRVNIDFANREVRLTMPRGQGFAARAALPTPRPAG
jgi:predicted aspartyl protease